MASPGERIHPDWLKAFIDYASYGEAPLKFMFWTGISTLAGALRRRVWIDQKFFQWVPNFYIVLVAPPGVVSKSTTANIGMNLLREVSAAHFGPDIITWQALVNSLAQAQEMMPIPNSEEFHTMSALTISSDEFGTFLNPDDREMIDVLVSLWDGKRGSIKKVTKTSGSDEIINPWINIIGCTTDAWIAGNFPEYMIGGGFTSRCIFAWANKKARLVPYIDEVVPSNFEQMRADLIHDLEIIANLYGEYQLDDSARTWGRQWYGEHWLAFDGEQDPGYYARKQTHLHKLAMVLAASQSDQLIITAAHLTQAHEILTSIEYDMPLIFSKIGQNDVTRGASRLVEIVEREGRVLQQTVFSQLFKSMSYRDFEIALMSALQAGKVRTVPTAEGQCLEFTGAPTHAQN